MLEIHKGSQGNEHYHNIAHMLDAPYQTVIWSGNNVDDILAAARQLLTQVEQHPEACAAALGVALQTAPLAVAPV
jgi:hypothetical protein